MLILSQRVPNGATKIGKTSRTLATAKKLESMAENKEKGTFQYKKYLFAGMTLCEGEGDIVYGVK